MKYTIDSHFTVIPAIGLDGFRSLKGDWDRLAINNGSYFPFLCYDWYANWLNHFPNTHLFIPVLYRDESIVAIMPLAKKTVRKKGLLFDVFEFIGNAYFQARAILFGTMDTNERTLCVEKLLQYFMKHVPHWDYLDLYGVQTENGNLDQISNASFICGLTNQIELVYANIHQDLIAVSVGEYISGRPKILCNNIQRHLRKMQRDGMCEFRLISDGHDIDAVMDTYYALYAKSWQRSEDLGPTFHRDLAKLAAERGWLRLGFIFFNGAPVACQLWFQFEDTAYMLKSFFDESFKRYSPGTVLTADMLRTVINDGRVRSVDFLQGDEAYKSDWLDGIRARKRLIIFNRSLKALLLSMLSKFKELLHNK